MRIATTPTSHAKSLDNALNVMEHESPLVFAKDGISED